MRSLRSLVAVPALLLGALAPGMAHAATRVGNVVSASVSQQLFFTTVFQRAGEAVSIQTSNLSAGGDTVIHVQDASSPSGSFIAGNDDAVGLASAVTVPAVGADRVLRVIVRSYSSSGAGTCDITISSPSNGTSTFTGQHFGGNGIFLGTNLDLSSHVSTIEQKNAGMTSTDTVMLVVSGNSAAHAVAFNDDGASGALGGVGLMSDVQLPEACPGSCLVVLGDFRSEGPINTKLLYDADIGNGFDADGDKLGDTLEANLHTLSNDRDSDHDGVNDHDEVLGVELNKFVVPAMKFPLMGADPTKQDMFVEVDWQKCVAPASNPTLCDPRGADTAQMAPSDVALIKTEFANAGLRVHMDIGTDNPDVSNFDYGNWGGAVQVTPTNFANPAFCEALSQERVGFFHHYLASLTAPGHSPVTGGARTGDTVSFCSSGTAQDRVAAHELGHQLGLGHGGRPWAADVNMKPNYLSIMDYGYEWNGLRIPGFSGGAGATLNPTGVDETVGVAGATDAVLAALSAPPTGEWSYTVNTATNTPLTGPKGAIDWNRDGLISPAGTLVRASVTQNAHPIRYDGAAYSGSSALKPMLDPVMAWVTNGAGTFSGDWLYVFGRPSGATAMAFTRISKTQINAGCSSFSTLVSDQFSGWDCTGVNNATMTTVPTTTAPAFAMGVAELGTGKLLIVRDQGGSIVSSIATIDPNTNNVSFSTPITLPGGVSATGDVAAVATAPGVVNIYVPSGSLLAQWTFSNNAWGNVSFAHKSSTTSIIVPQDPTPRGAAVTMGFRDGLSTPQVYAVIPIQSSGTNGQLMFARQESNGFWTDMTSSSFVNIGNKFAGARPALAYQHTPGAPAATGRFYMAWTPTTGSSAMMTMTEGNLSPGLSSTKRLVWTPPWNISVLGQVGQMTGLSLVSDPNRDSNLRALLDCVSQNPDKTFVPNTLTTSFLPLADGIVNVSLKDENDGSVMQTNLMAALGHGAPAP